MAEEGQEGRGFRVQDRRRFSPDTGEPRVTEEAPPIREQPQTAAPEQPRAAETGPGTGRATPPAEISFASFMLGLSTEALMYMGEIPAPPGQQVPTDLAAAQQMIDILAMLKEKTRGNLDAGEAAMLDNALFDLRMRYVELARKKA
jgi:hypothetical protein